MRDHAGTEHVAVLVDLALAVAKQQAAPLVAPVQELGVGGVALTQSSVVDLEPFRHLGDAHARHGLTHPLLAADQDRYAQAVAAPGERRADGLLLLALGERHALGVGTHPVDDHLHAARGRIEPRARSASQ